MKTAGATDDPVGTVLGAMNTFDVLEAGFQAASALIGSVSNLFKVGDDEPPAAEYIAEGTRMCVSGQPACGAQRVRCTWVRQKWWMSLRTAYYVSGDVRIGGPLRWYGISKAGKSQINPADHHCAIVHALDGRQLRAPAL
ncbi:hypothetical protein KCP71_00070 [Salmonella enterica subsp. enterica]|nr:hypothetical protein KCP71_00070 [Salmonella enterica subsp. enterica]